MENLVLLGSLWCMSVFFIFSGLVFLSSSFSLEMFISWFKFYYFSFFVDGFSVSMLFVLFFIYFVVLIFSKVYMNVDKLDFSFTSSVFVFVVGMSVFIWFDDWYLILIGWEILGVVSFMLIFYYGNYSGKICSLWTILINRLGDYGLILYFSFWILSGMSIEFLLNQSLFLLICLLSKSAQFPLGVWLPMAMSAPTPVSALVHSSTLVTAGVFVYLFSILWFSSFEFKFILWFGGFTVFIAGFSSLFEKDGKKIVALSTLFHLGLLVVLLSFGDSLVVYFHLFFHGFFKSFLFVCIGLVIYVLNHNQDVRVFWSYGKLSVLMYNMMIVSVLSLVGLPYFSGSFGKEAVLCGLESSFMSMFLMVVIVLSLACSLSYSLKLVSSSWLVNLGNSGGSVYFSLLFKMMSFLGLVSVLGWLGVEISFLSVGSGVVSLYSVVLFWFVSVVLYFFMSLEGNMVVLSSLVNLYYWMISQLGFTVMKVFSGLEDLGMSVVLSSIGCRSLCCFSLFMYWFSFFSMFFMGLIGLVAVLCVL